MARPASDSPAAGLNRHAGHNQRCGIADRYSFRLLLWQTIGSIISLPNLDTEESVSLALVACFAESSLFAYQICVQWGIAKRLSYFIQHHLHRWLWPPCTWTLVAVRCTRMGVCQASWQQSRNRRSRPWSFFHHHHAAQGRLPIQRGVGGTISRSHASLGRRSKHPLHHLEATTHDMQESCRVAQMLKGAWAMDTTWAVVRKSVRSMPEDLRSNDSSPMGVEA